MAISFQVRFGQLVRQLPVFGVAMGLALAGCGRQQTSDVGANADSLASGAEAQTSAADSLHDGATTNGAPPTTKTFSQKLQESPFADADPSLKESFARTLIAYDIGDYERAFTELNDLRNTSGLDAKQVKAIKELLAKILNAEPALAANNAVAIAPSDSQPETFALAADTEPPFSTAAPAVQETFARAKAAYDIGNYEVAIAELSELVTNAQLNAQQRYVARSLLDKTPRSLPGTQ